MSCEHQSPLVEVREERSVLVCTVCRTELVGMHIQISVPAFCLTITSAERREADQSQPASRQSS